MNDSSLRMIDSKRPPSPVQIHKWIGDTAYRFWMRLTTLIEKNYPHVFIPEWLFGGTKHGWSLRYKKGKSFCTMIPEKGRMSVVIVFGEKERLNAESIQQELSPRTQKDYAEATTYHDGKWLRLTVEDEEIYTDIEKLFSVKRKPMKH